MVMCITSPTLKYGESALLCLGKPSAHSAEWSTRNLPYSPALSVPLVRRQEQAPPVMMQNHKIWAGI